MPMLGQASPGPKYDPSSSFDKARRVPHFPTWGQPSRPPLKVGRDRASEVQFTSRRHCFVLQGHFSPGPQYVLPSMLGCSDGGPRWPRMRGGEPSARGIATFGPRHTPFELTAAIGGGARSPTQRPMTAPEAMQLRAFWSTPTTVERHSRRTPPATWHAGTRRNSPFVLRDLEEDVCRAPSREHAPHHQRLSISPPADPPFASPFGRVLRATEDFTVYAPGRIAGYGSPTVTFGKPSRLSARMPVQSTISAW
ncbi:hypothetical protein KFE25_003486 [Diacronema lutheri]|uniref:Uncharacterized protein n=1 Tax=Diacronema lutheri TaxID=2081491 RepID=A0A8J6CEC4_DIALT|nr:hypothetical protein KFE25_003486 [Diacronema lutheri]